MSDLVLKKSKFLQVQIADEKIVIWHSLFGYPKIISKETLEFLNIFSRPKKLSLVIKKYQIGKEDQVYIKDLINCYFLVPDKINERSIVKSRYQEKEKSLASGCFIKYLELIISESCNFRCRYCIHFNNIENSDRISNPNKIMNFVTAKKTVDLYLSILKKNNSHLAKINFGGGEPLLAWPVIEKTIRYCLKNYTDCFEFNFSINTNASLIDKNIAKKLKKYRVSVASSLDGLKKANDSVRISKSEKGTFDIILNGLNYLKIAKYPVDGISVTLNNYNFYLFDKNFIDWAKLNKMKELRIDIDVIGMIDIPNKEIIDKLISLKEYAKLNDINVSGFWSRPAENMNDSILDTDVAFCGATRGNNLCVNSQGEIYPCGYSNYKIGNIEKFNNLFKKNSKYCNFVKNKMIGEVKSCKGCSIEGQCIGGCAITREFADINKTAKIEKMCEFYQSMTRILLVEN
ncbi:MAG: radical SAM protein [Candidatus Paceibacterota bacterium]